MCRLTLYWLSLYLQKLCTFVQTMYNLTRNRLFELYEVYIYIWMSVSIPKIFFKMFLSTTTRDSRRVLDISAYFTPIMWFSLWNPLRVKLVLSISNFNLSKRVYTLVLDRCFKRWVSPGFFWLRSKIYCNFTKRVLAASCVWLDHNQGRLYTIPLTSNDSEIIFLLTGVPFRSLPKVVWNLRMVERRTIWFIGTRLS